jgi:hypothetical protein
MPLIALLVFILDVIAVINIVKSQKSGSNKALWILLIVFLPVLGLILYYVMGRK